MQPHPMRGSNFFNLTAEQRNQIDQIRQNERATIDQKLLRIYLHVAWLLSFYQALGILMGSSITKWVPFPGQEKQHKFPPWRSVII